MNKLEGFIWGIGAASVGFWLMIYFNSMCIKRACFFGMYYSLPW